MTQESEANGNWKPPYFTYATLNTFIDKKCGGVPPIPPRIDKTFIDNVAGGVQPLLLGALRLIGFIDEAGKVQPLLHEAASSPEKRKEIVRRWAENYYAEQITLANDNATSQMLAESFAKSDYQGSTLRKAIVFYLSLTDDLDLPKSPHFKAPKQPSASTARRKRQADEVSSVPRPEPAVSGEQKKVTLGSAGTVTIFVDVRWLDLPEETFTALRKAIREIETLSTDLVPPQTAEKIDSDAEDTT